MAIFTPKVIATALSTGGVSVGGGGAILLKQMPKNYREQLTKEGTYLLSKDNEYKAIYEDHKNKDYWTSENDLKSANTADDAKDKLRSYCSDKFQGSVPWISTEHYTKQKKKLISLCTSKGLKSVKARLIQSGKSGWIDEDNGDEKYKAVFAVYRYNKEFRDWLTEANSEANLTSSSEVDDNYSKLKTACSSLLKRPYKDIKDSKYFNYASWWCVELGYTTIKERIEKKVEGWQERPQSDVNWTTLVTKWKHTESVKKWANKANGGSDDLAELTADSLKNLCESKNISSQLSDNDSYQEKYLVIRTVCKKED